MESTNFAGSKKSKTFTTARKFSSAYSAKTSTRRMLAVAPFPFVFRAVKNDDNVNPDAPAAKVD